MSLKNCRAKGLRNVRICKKYLSDQGYLVDTVEKTGRFVKEKDLFGHWDVIALRENEVMFIQVKTNLTGTAWTKRYKEFADKYGNEHIKFAIFNWKDYKGFDVWLLNENTTFKLTLKMIDL